MKSLAAILLLCFSISKGLGQTNNEVLSHIPKTGKTIAVFIPRGYDTLKTAKGDLNLDGLADVAMVIHDKREDTSTTGDEINDSSRLLVVVFGTKSGWKLSLATFDIILCKACGGIHGDPFGGISIKNPDLTIDHDGGSNWKWANSDSYRFINGSFYHVWQSVSSYFALGYCDSLGEFSGSNETIDYMTGDRTRKQISEDCKLVLDSVDKIPVKPLIRIDGYKTEH